MVLKIAPLDIENYIPSFVTSNIIGLGITN